MELTKYSGAVIQIRKLASSIKEFQIQLLNPGKIAFSAGQAVKVLINDAQPEQITRTYSICSSPADNAFITLCIRLFPGRRSSEYLDSLNEGDPIEFLGPTGEFVLSENKESERVFIAIGTGIAPLKSMIHELLEKKVTSNIYLLFGVRNESRIIYDDEFSYLARKYSNFNYYLTLSKPSENWVGMEGRVTEAIDKVIQAGENKEFYLCGYGEMLHDTMEALRKKGVDQHKIFIEKYD